MLYLHRDTVTVSGGSVASVTLNVHDGLVRQLLVRALTSGTTVFRADLTDSRNTIIRRNYAYHEGEINDVNSGFPLQGTTVVNVTNASATDTFAIVLAVEELH